MLFAMADKAPALFVFLEPKDASSLREGRTLYVDPSMTGGAYFNQIIISQHGSREEIVKMIRSVQPNAVIPEHFPDPPPHEGEFVCKECKGSTPAAHLFEGVCVVCWATAAKKLRTQSN